MLDPDYIRNMTRRIRKVAQDLEDDVIVVLIAALLQMMQDEEVSEIEVAEEVNRIVEQYQIQGTSELLKIFRDAAGESIANDAKAIEEAQNVSEEQDLTEPSLGDPYIREVVNHFHRATQTTWQNLTRTVAYEGTRAYVNAADEAAIEVATGRSSREAITNALDNLVNKGIEIVENPQTGHRDHIDVAMDRNVRTTVSKMAGDITLQNCVQNGINLVLVSAHFGARPTHEVWQGKVYSLIGDTGQYKDFYRETEYGQMLGLCGINCRHSFSPFVEGMHNPYEDEDYSDPQRYKDEQTQRAMERRIRKLRRKKRELDEIWKYEKTPELRAERQNVAKALRNAIREYEEFCAEHDFRPLWERTRA